MDSKTFVNYDGSFDKNLKTDTRCSHFSDSLDSSCNFTVPKQTTSFVSLIDSSLLYFTQTTPITTHAYNLKKTELENKTKDQMKQYLEMKDNYKNIKEMYATLKNDCEIQENVINNFTRQAFEMTIINKKKRT